MKDKAGAYMKLSQTISDNLEKIGKCIDIADYSFLDTNENLHNPVLIGLGGSHAYGTNMAGSDMDIRGIAMHSKEDLLLGRGFEQVINEKTDTVIYSFKKICSLLANCNPNVIELLGLKPEHYLYTSPLGQKLIDNVDMFLSMKCVNSFMGYANSQMYRLQQKTLSALSETDLNNHICKTMNGMRDMLEKQHDMKGVDVHMKDGKIVLDLDVKDYPIESLSGVLGALNNTLRDYNKSSQRNNYAIEHNKVAKHSMHLLRLYMMCEDLLVDGKIVTYREKEHDLLMDIRNGGYLAEDGKPTKEFFDIVREYEDRLDRAKQHSVLPERPDMERIEKFMIKANEEVISQTDSLDLGKAKKKGSERQL